MCEKDAGSSSTDRTPSHHYVRENGNENKTGIDCRGRLCFGLYARFGSNEKFDCSPGYWKNHLEVWIQGLLRDATELPPSDQMLYATGPANGQVKNPAADIINGFADENLETACEDES